MKRFRLFDLNTPLFWVVIFFRRQYGKPWLEALVYPSQYPLRPRWRRWWLHGLDWEAEPTQMGAYVPGEEGGDG